MRLFKLKNGATVPQVLVTTTMMNIGLLTKDADKDPLAMFSIYELGKKAHDNNHKIFSQEIEKNLKSLSLLQQDGSLHECVKDIAQSAITFDSNDIPMVENPIDSSGKDTAQSAITFDSNDIPIIENPIDSSGLALKLKNGGTVDKAILKTTMMNIGLLTKDVDKDPLAMFSIYELGKKAHDNNHKIFTQEIEKNLKSLSLLQQDGSLHECVKDIAQSAITFDSNDIPMIEDPIDSSGLALKLKNGGTVAKAVLKTTMMNIGLLTKDADKDPLAMFSIYELGKKAHDNNHKIFSQEIEKNLKSLSLLQQDGSLHECVKDIAQSAITFDSNDIPMIEDPIISYMG